MMRDDHTFSIPTGGALSFSPRRARGVYRLAQFMAITASAIARGKRQGELDETAAVAFGNDLATRIIDQLGITVSFTGDRPRGLFLLVSNHRSYMDIPVLMSAAPAIFLAKQEIQSWPLIGTASTMAKTIFVDRDSRPSRKRALAEIRSQLGAGVPVALFPEGTTTRGPSLLPFRPGSFWAAAELGVPVVPVAVSYADPENAWIDDDPFVGHFIRQLSAPTVDIRVSFGPTFSGRDGFELRDSAEAWIRSALEPRDAIAFSPRIAPLVRDDDEEDARPVLFPGGLAPAT